MFAPMKPTKKHRQETKSPGSAAIFLLLFFRKHGAFQLLLCRIEVHLQNGLAADICALIGAVRRHTLLRHVIGRQLQRRGDCIAVQRQHRHIGGHLRQRTHAHRKQPERVAFDLAHNLLHNRALALGTLKVGVSHIPDTAVGQRLLAVQFQLAAAVQLPQTTVETALEDLRVRYAREDSGLCLLHLDTRWQLATRTEWADCIRRLLDARRSVPLGPAAMETLTVIAYNQPVSRAFIEQVRGVDSSSSVSGLLEKGLIEEAGRLDLPGRPVAFRTTDVFLRCFGLSSLGDLPPVRGTESEAAQ